MANEVSNRKAILAALGATGSTQNETEFNKSLINALKTGANSRAKPQIVALTGASTAADIVAALKA